MSITNWSDVKHDPALRLVYHKENFDELLVGVEEITREMERARVKGAVPLRVLLDGMVKCFDQFYCDVNQGFPGYKHATWEPTDSTDVAITQDELSMLYEALEYAKCQIVDSYIPVFDKYKEDGEYTSASVTRAEFEATKLMDKIELISCNDAGSLVLGK